MFVNLTGATDMFGARHLIFLTYSAVLLAVGIIFTKKLSIKQMTRVLLVVGIMSETIKIVVNILNNENKYFGYLPKTDLPFHLCSIQLIFIVLLNATQNKKLIKLLCGFMIPTCLIGGVAAIFLPTWGARNTLIIAFQYYTYHVAIMVWAIYLFRQKEMVFVFRDYINTLIMLAFLGVLAIYLNSWILDESTLSELSRENIKINFMYVVAPPQNGLPFLTNKYGWGVYICHYMLLAVFMITLCYIKVIINKISGKEKKMMEEQQPVEVK